MTSTHTVEMSYSKINELLAGDTDRGAALVAAALLESQLEKLILAATIQSKKIEMFKGGGMFETFSEKIRACYLLGLINKEIFDELELIRKIRNVFAHDFGDIDFDSNDGKNKISDWAKSLKGAAELANQTSDSEDTHEFIKQKVRHNFEFSVFLVSLYLDTAAHVAQRPNGMQSGYMYNARRNNEPVE